MSMHELEHFILLCQKLIEKPILLFLIGLEIASEYAYVLLMVKVHLLNIKGDGFKTLREVLKGADIVKKYS